MTLALEDDSVLLDRLRAEFGKQETMQRLFETVLPHLEAGKKTLVYILAQVDRIGHTAGESFFLKSLYGPRYDRILLVTGRGAGAGYNPYILDCIGPEFVRVITDDPILPLLGFLDNAIFDLKHFDLCLSSPQRLVRDFGRFATTGGELRYFTLPEEIEAKGLDFTDAVGMPRGAPFVALHVREMSYLPEKGHLAFRCADLARYDAAIERFLEAGYWVFRLDDGLNKPMRHADRRVVDVPLASGYDPSLDIYFCARCAFSFNQASGPEAIVRAFGRPSATVNLVYELLRLPLPGDLLLFKHYAMAGAHRPLSYRELTDLDIPAVTSGYVFDEQGIDVLENTEEELEAAAVEMIELLNGGAELSATEEQNLDRFHAISSAYEQSLIGDPAKQIDNFDFYAYAHAGFGRPARSVLQREGFLDRD